MKEIIYLQESQFRTPIQKLLLKRLKEDNETVDGATTINFTQKGNTVFEKYLKHYFNMTGQNVMRVVIEK